MKKRLTVILPSVAPATALPLLSITDVPLTPLTYEDGTTEKTVAAGSGDVPAGLYGPMTWDEFYLAWQGWWFPVTPGDPSPFPTDVSEGLYAITDVTYPGVYFMQLFGTKDQSPIYFGFVKLTIT